MAGRRILAVSLLDMEVEDGRREEVDGIRDPGKDGTCAQNQASSGHRHKGSWQLVYLMRDWNLEAAEKYKRQAINTSCDIETDNKRMELKPCGDD